MGLKATIQVRENIRELMRVRQFEQKDVAFGSRRHPTWINKILKGTRPIKVADLDTVADILGVATYQLLQPGISAISERRSGKERRTGQDRRLSHQQRIIRAVASEIDRAHPRRRQQRS